MPDPIIPPGNDREFVLSAIEVSEQFEAWTKHGCVPRYVAVFRSLELLRLNLAEARAQVAITQASNSELLSQVADAHEKITGLREQVADLQATVTALMPLRTDQVVPR